MRFTFSVLTISSMVNSPVPTKYARCPSKVDVANCLSMAISSMVFSAFHSSKLIHLLLFSGTLIVILGSSKVTDIDFIYNQT